MPGFSFTMHQIQFWLELHSRVQTLLGSIQRSHRPLAEFRGSEKEWKGRKRRGIGKGRGEEGRETGGEKGREKKGRERKRREGKGKKKWCGKGEEGGGSGNLSAPPSFFLRAPLLL